MKIKTGTLLRILISVSALVLIPWFLRDKLHEAFAILRTEVRLPFFLLACAMYFLSIGMLALRFHIALRAKQFFWGFANTLYVSYMGIFFSLFLPSAIGGDVIKAVYLSKHARQKADVFSCLVVDRLSGFCIVMLLAFLSSALLQESWNPIPAWASWLALGIGISGGLAVFFYPAFIPFIFSKLRFLPKRFQEKLNQFYDSLSGFFQDRPFLIQSLLCSIVAQSLFITAYYFIGQSLDAPIPFFKFFMMVPMITILSMAPSINGLGVREAGALFLFKMYMPDERALAMTVLVDVLIYSFSFLGGIWYLIKSLTGDDPRKPA